jgi:phosphosulfolactate synthase (CoM biosynthesis protein A)
MSYLRNGGIITKGEYEGKTLDEATKYAEEGGFIVRVVEIDGNSLMMTADNKTNRINFRVKGGYVSDAFGG